VPPERQHVDRHGETDRIRQVAVTHSAVVEHDRNNRRRARHGASWTEVLDSPHER